MEPHSGNGASAPSSKGGKEKKPKKNYEDGDGKKKFVSTPVRFVSVSLFV